MLNNRALIILLVIGTGILSSCTHPVSPPPASSDQVVISGSKSGLTLKTYTFIAKINFTSATALSYKWVFDDSAVTTIPDSIGWQFKTAGTHIFSVSVVQNSDNSVLCSATDTIMIGSSPYLAISPDSTKVNGVSTVLFTATLEAAIMPTHYSVVWQMDTAHFTVANHDTTSITFWTQVTHTVSATLLDSTGHTIATGATLLFDTIHQYGPNDTTSNNFTWIQFTNVSGENDMTGCWVFAPNDIYALNGNLHHFDGTSWTLATLNGQAPGALSGFSIFGFNDNDFWIYGYDILYHWNGTNVIETRLESTGVYSTADGAIHSAWGTSSSDMFFVGDSGTILHFDGTNWTKMNSGTTRQLNSICGTSDNNIYAVGYNTSTGQSEVLHYNGSSWSEDVLATSGTAQNWGIGSVWACDSASHTFAAASGTSVFRRTDNGTWRNDSIIALSTQIGMDVTGQSSNDIFAVGSFGLVLHWNGASWQRYDQFLSESDPSYFPQQISMNENTICIVGYKDGTSWVLVGQRQ